MLCYKQEKPTKIKYNLFKIKKKHKNKEKSDGFGSDFCLKTLLLLAETARFAKKQFLMRETEFECICAMICDGNYEPADIPTALDNLFYERFGMSCSDVVSAFSMH